MSGSLFMMITMMFVLMAMVLSERSTAKWSRGFLMGVKLSEEMAKQPEAVQIARRFRRELDIASGVCAALALGIMLVEDFGTNMLLWMLWLIPCLTLPVLPAMRANKALRAWKTERLGPDACMKDGDDHWVCGGLFYYNPDDPHAMVDRRVGYGLTVNMARLGGKLFGGIGVGSIALCVGIGIWIFLMGAQKTGLSVEEGKLRAAHGSGVKYSIAAEEITDISLHEELPSASRTFGVGMPRYLQGMFAVKGYGSCSLCLDPTVPPFLCVRTGGKTYWLNAADPAQTRAVYETLCAETGLTGGQ